jgi:prefoldin subunit 5
MSAAASGGFQDIVRTVKAAFGANEALAVEQEYQAAVIAAIERRVKAVTDEVGGLTSRAQLNRYQDATVSDRFATIETDIAALTAEIRALRVSRNDVTAGAPAAQVDFLEATLVEVGSGVGSLRSSFDAFAEAHRKDIADLAQSTRKDITAITTRVNRIEQALATRDLTGSIPTQVRRKKAKKRRPAAIVRGPGDMAPFQPVPHPLIPGPLVVAR